MKFLSHDGLLYFWKKTKSYVDTKYNELFQSVSNGKSLVASAITGKGITTDATATFATMASNINNIKTGVDTSDATATAGHIVSGKTAYVNGSKVTGSMPNRTLVDSTIGGISSSYPNISVYDGIAAQFSNQTVDGKTRFCMSPPTGYYVEAGSYVGIEQTQLANIAGLTADKLVARNTVFGITGTATSDATATANEIYTGRTAYVNGSKVTGTMADVSAFMWAGSNGADSNAFNDTDMATGYANNNDVGAFDIKTRVGYINGSAVRLHIPNLLAKNIVSGVKVGWANAYIEGTAKGETDLLNFPLSIQATQPTAVRNGHIWIKSSTLASQISAIYIQETLNAGAGNGSLQFIVGETSGNHYLWMHNGSKSLTDGGTKSTQVTMNNSVNTDWTVTLHSGLMEYKLNKPMIYSKINNVLDIETAYMYNGSSWVLLCEKGSYAITQSLNSSTGIGLKVWNRADATFTLSQEFDTSAGSATDDHFLPYRMASRDGRVFTSPKAQVYRIFVRSGDTYTKKVDIPYNKQVTYGTNGWTFNMRCLNAVPSGNGEYVFVHYRGLANVSNSYHLSQIVVYKFDGSTYVLSQESALYQMDGTFGYDETGRQIAVDDSGTVCCYADKISSTNARLRLCIRNSSGIHISSTTIGLFSSDSLYRIVVSPDGQYVYVGTSNNTISRYTINQQANTYTLKDTISSVPSNSGASYGYLKDISANGILFIVTDNHMLVTYNTTTGVLAKTTSGLFANAKSDISISPDGTKFLHADTSSNGIRYYSISTSGTTITATLLSQVATGSNHYRVALIPN